MDKFATPHIFFFLHCRAHHYSSDGHEVEKKTTTSLQRGKPFKTTQKQNTQLGQQRRQQQQEEPVQAEPEGAQEQQHHLAKTKMEELGLRSVYVFG